jgi:transposase
MLLASACTSKELLTPCTSGSPSTRQEVSQRWCTNREGTAVFPPSSEQGEQLRELTRQAPGLHGVSSARWRLADLRAVVPWLSAYTLPGICLALQRLKIKRKRGRLHLHSPDPLYMEKIQRVKRATALAHRYPQRVALVYADEFSLHRQPTLAGGGVYYPQGEEPLVELSLGSNTRYRVSGALDACTGRLTYTHAPKIGIAVMQRFLEQLRKAYPDKVLFLAWDNWTVHRHPAVLAKAAALRIHILWLPTYAPWTNPIEKLWRWVRQQVVHNHALADRWEELKRRVSAFLDTFTHDAGSVPLLRYVGLLPLPS